VVKNKSFQLYSWEGVLSPTIKHCWKTP